MEALQATVEEMREASERMGRKDWLLVAIGAATTLVITAAIPAAAAVHGTTWLIHEGADLFGEELAG